MDKEFKKNIQEALKAELQKENMSYVNDQWRQNPPKKKSSGSAIGNLARAGVGHLRLSGVNKQITKSAKKIDKEWQKTKKYVDKKAQKMAKSKYAPVAQNGREIENNMTALDRAMNAAIQKLGHLSQVGAQDPRAASHTPHYEDWLKKWGIDPIRLSKGPGNEYGRIANQFHILLRFGINPMEVHPSEFDAKMKEYLQKNSQDPYGDWARVLKKLGRSKEAAMAEKQAEAIGNKQSAESPEGAPPQASARAAKKAPKARAQRGKFKGPFRASDYDQNKPEAEQAPEPSPEENAPQADPEVAAPQQQPQQEQEPQDPNFSMDDVKSKMKDSAVDSVASSVARSLGMNGDAHKELAKKAIQFALGKLQKQMSPYASEEEKAEAMKKAKEYGLEKMKQERKKYIEQLRMQGREQKSARKKSQEEFMKNVPSMKSKERLEQERMDAALAKEKENRLKREKSMEDYPQNQAPMNMRSSGDNIPNIQGPDRIVRNEPQIRSTIPAPPPQQYGPNVEEPEPFDLTRRKNMAPHEMDQRFEDLQADEDLQSVKFSDMYGSGDQEEVEDNPKTEEKLTPGMEISRIAQSLAKKQKNRPKNKSKKIQGHINDEGEEQFGVAPSEDPLGKGQSAMYQAKDRTYKKKKNKKPSARRKK